MYTYLNRVILVQYDEKWIVKDATFNLSYVDEANNILDVREIKRRVENGECVQRIYGDTDSKCYISSLSSYGGIYECIDAYEKSGIYFYIIRMDADVYANSRERELKPIFDKDNLMLSPENMFHYYGNIQDPMQNYRNALDSELRLSVQGV